MIISRDIQEKIRESARGFPVIGIFGPRQTGKTTVAKMVFSDYSYVNLEDPDSRAYAKNDPRNFFANYMQGKGLIIDEFQHVPELLSYLQTIVDREQKMGYFVLTGSQNFLMNAAISQSLAGRIAIHTLLPLSLHELSRANSVPPSLNYCMYKGGYPALYSREISTEQWFSSYMQTYVERDVREIINVENLSVFRNFLQLCAGRVGQLLNITSIGNDCGVSDNTIRRWISLLESSYIIFLLRPHHKNWGKRIIKTPKLYFYDTGLLCHLLNIQSEKDIALHFLRGGIFESFVISELHKYFYNKGKIPHLYFWRDRSGHEVDCIIERSSNELLPIEIKSGQTIQSNFFDGIARWYDTTKLQTPKGFLVYAGEQNSVREQANVIGWKDIYKITE